MNTKIVQLNMFPELEKKSFEISMRDHFKCLFAKHGDLLKAWNAFITEKYNPLLERHLDLEEAFLNLKKRVDNISDGQ